MVLISGRENLNKQTNNQFMNSLRICYPCGIQQYIFVSLIAVVRYYFIKIGRGHKIIKWIILCLAATVVI